MLLSEFSSIERPPRGFNLLYLDDPETYISTIQVERYLDAKRPLVKGRLHLCSRCLVFEPNEISEPLIKMRYNSSFSFNHFTAKELSSPQEDHRRSSSIKDSRGESKLDGQLFTYQTFSPSANQIDRMSLQRSLFTLVEDLQLKEKKALKYSLCDALVIDIPNFHILERQPCKPHVTEKNNASLIFFHIENQEMSSIASFSKNLQYLSESDDEVEIVEHIIQRKLNELYKEWELIYPKNYILLKYRAKKVTSHGTQTGIFYITNEGTIHFQAVANDVEGVGLKIRLRELKYIMKYRFCFMHCGINIWIYKKSRSDLIIFDNENTRDTVFAFLLEKQPSLQDGMVSLKSVCDQWVRGEISNFDYLMYLNTVASRSSNDLAQYPIFPWVVTDFTSSSIDLNNPEIYRDLSKPVGAINKSRLAKFKERYEEQLADNCQDPPFLYGAHYSTSGNSIYFLVRQVPEFMIRLQNGVFGPPDRIFRSIESTWWSSMNVASDVKELTPEFYGDGDFLLNTEEVDLGVTQNNEIIDDVILPPWAETSLEFCQKMRDALESDIVSASLHHWLDLIFGFKQTGENAVYSDNLFYHFAYEKNVTWDQSLSKFERQGLFTQVQEFGQCPQQLFMDPHPRRQFRKLILDGPSKEAFGDEEKHLVMKKIQVSSQEVERLKNELLSVNQMHQSNLNKQHEEFQQYDKKRRKQIVKMKRQHTEDIKGQNDKLVDLENQDPRLRQKQIHPLKTQLEELKENHKKELARYSSRYNALQYIKSLETAVNKYKKKEGQLVGNMEKLQERYRQLEDSQKDAQSRIDQLQKELRQPGVNYGISGTSHEVNPSLSTQKPKTRHEVQEKRRIENDKDFDFFAEFD